MSYTRMIIGADIVPTESNMAKFVVGDIEHLIGEELIGVLESAEHKIFNLEVPLTDVPSPIVKQGPRLRAAENTIHAIKKMNIDLMTLANNHILDHGVRGMRNTCRILGENGIAYVGVGNDMYSSATPYIINDADMQIGIYACTENEFSVATATMPGANPYDALEVFDHIATLKSKCDRVVVLYHGGKEHYRYPSPDLQRVCRKMIGSGADLVICQHTHCIGCEEKYMHGTIVYGQGNFIFDYNNSEFWQTSLLVRVDDDFNIDYVPLVKQDEKVRLARGEEAEKILNDFRTRSCEILEKGFVQRKYNEFADSMVETYYDAMTGKKWSFMHRLLKKLSAVSGIKLIKTSFNRRVLLGIENYSACEAHRELMLCGVRRVYHGKNEKTDT